MNTLSEIVSVSYRPATGACACVSSRVNGQATRNHNNKEKEMKLSIIFLAMGLISLMCLLAVMTGPAYADDWAKLSGAETLQELVSGARVEIQLKPGVIAIGEYYADGRVIIIFCIE